MTEIVISGFESLSFSNPSSVRKSRNSKGGGVQKKRKGATTRLGKDQFLKLSSKEQERYLETFPKSSHRNLIGGKEKDSSPEPEKEAKKPKTGKAPEDQAPAKGKKKKGKKAKKKEQDFQVKDEKPKKISHEDFLKLSEKEQKAYKKAYPKDSFTRKHHVTKKKNIVEQNKTGDAGETVLDGSEKSSTSKQRKAAENKALKQGRDEARKDVRHGVTQEATDALKTSKPEDLKAASKNLKDNREDNVRNIKKTLRNRHEFVSFDKKEIKRAQEAMRREAKRDETTWNNRDLNKTKKLLERLEKGDTQKLTKHERELLERVGESAPKKKEPFWKRDLNTLKQIMTGEKVEPEGRSNAMLALTMVSRYALRAGGVAALSIGAAPAALHIAQHLFSQWDDFTVNASSVEDIDEHADADAAIYAAYDAVADTLAHMDHEEFVEDVTKTFREFRSESSSDDMLSKLMVFLMNTGVHVKTRRQYSLGFRTSQTEAARNCLDRFATANGFSLTADSDNVEYSRNQEQLTMPIGKSVVLYNPGNLAFAKDIAGRS